MEIAPGINRIETPLGERRCSVYLLVGADAALLVDTGLAGAVEGSILPAMAAAGIDPDKVRLILISHADIDHCGDAAAAKAAFPRALLACGREDMAQIASLEEMVEGRYGQFAADHAIADSPETKAWYRETGRFAPPDLGLSGGEVVDLGGREVQVLHTPGHSRGHLTVWDPRSRAAIIIDAALGRTVPTAKGEPAFPPTYRDVDPYLGSIQRLQALQPELLLTAHEPTMEGQAAGDFLAESRAFAELAEVVTLETLRGAGPSRTADLLRLVGPRLGPWPVEATLGALAFPIVGHLERLETLGHVHRRRGDDGLVVWEAAPA
jgi:glyoxylase-like metal-dependent hydrolase (beta-lactamase superfamily II)